MQQKKTRRGREYLNDFRRDVNGSYLYQGSYRCYTGSMPYAGALVAGISVVWALPGHRCRCMRIVNNRQTVSHDSRSALGKCAVQQ